MRVGLTGAYGFVGSHLKEQLRGMGHAVIPLVREGREGETDWLRFSLEEGVEAARLSGLDAVIHCAYDFRAGDAGENDRRNIEGSLRLFQAARSAGVRSLIFVSTFSAFPGCRSLYGKGKLAVERAVSDLRGVNVRLGFVYDGSERGLSGKLKKLATTLPVILLPGSGGQKLYPLSALDLGAAIVRVIEAAKPGTVVSLAQSEPVTFADLLREYAKSSGKRVYLIPAPWQPLWLMLRCLEAAGAKLAFRSDSLVSLVNQNQAPDFSATRELGLIPRSMEGS